MKLLKILGEKNPLLKQVCKEFTFPISEENKLLINDMIEYLKNTQIDEIASKYNLRPGMGLAANQLGKNLRFFVVVMDKEENLGDFDVWVIINPKIISASSEMIYADGGEGCLSVNREVKGVVLRHARVSVEYYDINGNKQVTRVREEIAVAFQHEIDHLNGILFTDKTIPIDNNIINNYRSL